MKKLAAIALAAVLSFGWAAPALAAGPHHGTGRCLNYSEICQGVAQKVITPGLQSINDRLNNVLVQVNGVGSYVDADGDGVCDNYSARGGRQMTAPGLCARGACGRR